MMVRSTSRLVRKFRRYSIGSVVFDFGNYIFMVLVGFITIGPFLYLLAGSLTQADYYRTNGPTFLPNHWSLQSYQILLSSSSRIYSGLRVSMTVTIIGTFLSLFFTAGLAYGLSKKTLPGHKVFIFYVFFTMLFGGGLIPFYLVVNGLKLTNTIWSLVFPFLLNAWYTFIMVKFFETLPKELDDAARIDGANELQIFLRIVLPLSAPVLATIGLFYAVGYWNEWFWPTVFISDQKLIPLQLVLRQILSKVSAMNSPTQMADILSRNVTNPPPAMVLRMAAIIITVFPIAIVYPFLQKYFVKGVMIGAIKE